MTPEPAIEDESFEPSRQLPRGRHEVRFTYEAPGYIRGLQITLLSLSILLLWAGGAAYAGRRASGSVSAAIK